MLGTIPSYHQFPSYLSLNKSYIGDLAAVLTLFLSHIHTHSHAHAPEHVSDTEVPGWDWTGHFCRWQQNAEENRQRKAVSVSMTTSKGI